MTVNSDGSLFINIGGPQYQKTMSIMPMLVIAFLFSMWDVYVPQLELRVLDFVGVGLLCFWIFSKSTVDMRGPVFRTRNIHLLALMIAWSLVLSVVGVMESMENIKPIFGILMGVAVFSYFYSIRLDDRSVAKVLSILIVIHASYLIIQYLYYQVFGIVPNIYEFLGTEPHALSSIFRPTGLFLEPASYSVSILILLTLRIFIIKRFDAITYIGVGTIFLTLSVWGLIAVVIVLLIFTKNNTKIFIIAAALVMFIALPFTEGISAPDSPLSRLINLGEDSSAIARYGGLVGDVKNTLSFNNLWFGKGISNEYIEFGSSGMAFILSAGGLFGFCIFLLLLFLFAPSGRRIVTLVIILLLMTAAPIWTTMYWWWFLALMMRPLARVVQE